MLAKLLVLGRAVGFEKLVFVSKSILSYALNELISRGNSFKSAYCVLRQNQSLCCANNRGRSPSISLASAAVVHALLMLLDWNLNPHVWAFRISWLKWSEIGEQGWGLQSSRERDERWVSACPVGFGNSLHVGITALFSVLLHAVPPQTSQGIPVFDSASNSLITKFVVSEQVAL